MLFSWADCAAPFGCLNAPGFEGTDDQPTGLPVVAVREESVWSTELLLESAETGDLEGVRRIIESGKVDVNAVDEVDSYSALMMSAEAGHLEVVKALLAARADVEIRDSYGRTPLYAAAVAGHVDVVRHLVTSAKADVAALDCEERNVLWACCAVRRLDVAAFLLDEAGSKCDLNKRAASGDSAMAFAIKHGHAEVVDFLKQNGARDANSGRLSMQ